MSRPVYRGGLLPDGNRNGHIHGQEPPDEKVNTAQVLQRENVWLVIEERRVQPMEVTSIDGAAKELDRVLDANQAFMIAIGGTFGTGLLVGSGDALRQGGPAGILIAYALVCAICYCMMTGLCEMATFLPNKKGFVGLISRYVHPAVGFAVGWIYLCQYLIAPALLIDTAARVMDQAAFNSTGRFADQTAVITVDTIHPWELSGLWRFLFTVIVVGVNCFPTRVYGKFEFWQSTFKIFALIALLIFGLVVDLGGARLEDGGFQVLGGMFWRSPYSPFGSASSGSAVLGVWFGIIHALFSLIGIEQIGAAIGEIENPRRSIPKAIRRTYMTVFTLYMLGVVIVGLICASDENGLSDPDDSKASPFLIVAHRLAYEGLAKGINAAIILFSVSCATAACYIGSRVLYGLALDGQAPAVFGQVIRGRPVLALATSAAFCFLSYAGMGNMNLIHVLAAVRILIFAPTLASLAGLMWICIFWAHIRFRLALKAQDYNISSLRYRSRIYPYGTWVALCATILINAFQGCATWVALGDRASLQDSVATIAPAYIFAPMFVILFGGWKTWHNITATPLEDIDLSEGREEVEHEEREYEHRRNERRSRSWWQRVLK